MAAAGFLVDSLATLTATGAVCALLLWGAKQFGSKRQTGPLQLEGELSLGPRRAIYLVRAGSRLFLVGASEAGLSPLGEFAGSEIPPDAVPPVAPLSRSSFADFLARRVSAPAAATPGETHDEKPEEQP